ncbi:MAG: glycosyltransferase [Lachnospiraceae bacterium]|nr:glycosyltransferase [Lachnospiraceae bacterium]
MKILWLINFELPILGNNEMVNEGWISGMYLAIKEYFSDADIILLFPQIRLEKDINNVNGVKSIGYYERGNIEHYDPGLKNKFKQIIESLDPEVIHIMGTEYPHAFSMCEACIESGIVDRLIVSIQGMVSYISEAYCLGLPNNVRYGFRLKDLVYGNVNRQAKRFAMRGEYERRVLECTHRVIGRTEWDKMCVRDINDKITYYHNNEVLRQSFYDNKWEYANCMPNTVFITQGNYPIKGIHILIEAANVLKRNGYDLQYRIAGENHFSKPRWKWSKYTEYLHSLMNKYLLSENFVFLGPLDETAIVKEYLKANMFILPSLIENSSNSLGEAMILGMPVIASDVGGTKDFVKHGVNGYLFSISEPYMMAHYVMEYLENRDNAMEMGRQARITALKLYDRENNASVLMDIYKGMES